MDKSKFNELKEWRNFGIGLGVILAVIATVQLIMKTPLQINNIPVYVFFYGAAVLSFVLALVLPILLKPVYILFMYIGFGLGFVMTRLILGILFYLIITPIGWLGRLFGKRFLDTGFKRDRDSYWLPSPDPQADSTTGKDGTAVHNFENQF